ncbi:MAG: T9SS type A sorting domain-containing protein [Saprospiraceae bacterium]|nr:T9SS type A sorting domain-containing protein [Candidatus Vicinibacter affinis]
MSQTLVKDINPGIKNGLTTNYFDYVQVGNYLYFTANDGVSGFEMWRTDGTTNGTQIIQDLSISPLHGPRNLMLINGKIFFIIYNGTSSDLYVLKNPEEFDINNIVIQKVLHDDSETYNSYGCFIPLNGNEVCFLGIKLNQGTHIRRLNLGSNPIISENIHSTDNILTFGGGNRIDDIVQNEMAYDQIGNLYYYRRLGSGVTQLVKFEITSKLVLASMDFFPSITGIEFPLYYKDNIYLVGHLTEWLKSDLYSVTNDLQNVTHILLNADPNYQAYVKHLIKYNDKLYFNATAPDLINSGIWKFDVVGSPQINYSNIEYYSMGFRHQSPFGFIGSELYILGGGIRNYNLSDFSQVPNLNYAQKPITQIGTNYYHWYNDVIFHNMSNQLYINNFTPYKEVFDLRCDCSGGPLIPLGNDYLFFASLEGVNEGLELYKMDGDILRLGTSSVNEHVVNVVNVFPNPSFDFINLSLGRNFCCVSNINVIDVNGKIVATHQQNLNSQNIILPISKLRSGCYFVEVLFGNIKERILLKFAKM